MPSAIATITSLVDKRHWGKAISVHELAPNLAFFVSPFIAEFFLAGRAGAPRWASSARLSIAASVTFSTFRAGRRLSRRVAVLERVRRVGAHAGVLADGRSVRFGRELHGWRLRHAAAVSGDRTRTSSRAGPTRLWRFPVRMVRFSGCSAAGLRISSARSKRSSSVWDLPAPRRCCLGLLSDHWLSVAVLFQPLLAVWFFPAAFAAIAMITPANARNLAVAFSVPFGFLIGGGAIPTFIGAMGDAGSFATGFMVTGALIASGGTVGAVSQIAAASDEER